ncbi:MAG: BREX-1 system phosphatase PglZ type B [Phycisphaerales bacterium]
MSHATANPAATLLDAIQSSLEQAARHNPGDVSKPAAILWTDAEAQWAPIIPLLQATRPYLLVLGAYAPEQKRGPAIWLKCVMAGVIPEFQIAEATVPIIYMPGVSRQVLRAGEECPDALKPLAELQYRGAVWTQKNGKDWTVEAFLVSEDGVGLDLAKDAATKAAMLGSLSALAETPLSVLRGKRLEAEDFDRLVIDDQPRDLLTWLGEPEGTRRRWDAAKWSAFCSRCKADYGFDPIKDGETAGGEKLGLCKQDRDPAWEAVWARFNDAPGVFTGITELLKRSKPAGLLFLSGETWPDQNDDAETRLRNELLGFDELSHTDARRKIETLEKEHESRRTWVWSRLGRSPLAMSLSYLAVLGQKTASKIGGDSADEMARLYAEGGYITDEAAMRALAGVRTAADMRAVQTAVRSLYLPWLEAAAEHFQKLVARSPLPAKGGGQEAVSVPAGHCLLFADGLRFDLGQRLAAKAEERGLRVNRRQRWAALPTVTASAKPAASPVAGEIAGNELPETFAPDVAATKQSLTTDRFRKLLMEEGYEVLAGGHETGTPGRPNARAWAESGQIDKLGHDLQGKLVSHLDSEIEALIERIMGLLDAGWRSVRVVTDHGWLLLPGADGLPKADLPGYLTASRWARCAAIKGASRVSVPTAAWHWNTARTFATAPGVHCFGAGNEYAHGGLSLQECVLPDLLIEPANAGSVSSASFVDVQWLGMRCRVLVEPGDPTLTVDVRTKPNDPGASIATSPKALALDGKAGLIVEDEELAGTAAVLVVLDSAGRVIAKKPTTVGGEE